VFEDEFDPGTHLTIDQALHLADDVVTGVA